MIKQKRPLKIAIFHCGFVYSGGGERIVLEQAKGLKNRGYEVEVFAPTIDNKLCYPHMLQELGVKTFLPSFIDWLPFRDAIRMVATSVLAPALAYKFKDIDMFLGANQPGAWLAFCIAKTLKKPYLVYLNQPNRLVYPRKIDKETGWYTRKDYHILAEIIKVIKPFVAWADKISVISDGPVLVNGDYIGRIIQNTYKTKVIVCPGGTYYKTLVNLKLNKDFLYSGKLWVNNKLIKKPYLLISNRHEPQKCFDYVIRAFKQVLEQNSNLSLIIPGTFTSYTKKLINLCKSIDCYSKVVFLKQISESNLKKIYQNALIHCYPSPEEDFGLGPLEAGGWGVPTVAWNNAGPTVTIKHKKTGYLAKPYEISDYAKGILWLAEPVNRIKTGKEVLKHIKDNFSWNKHVDILEKEINKVLQSRIF